MRRLLLSLVLTLLAFPALADLTSCQTSVNGALVPLVYDADNAALKEAMSYQERALGGWGKIDCPALVTLRYLTPELDDTERAPFCLTYDADAKTYTGFSEGERSAYLICHTSKSLCQRVNDSADTAMAIVGFGNEATAQANAVTETVNSNPLTRRSGAVILSGATDYLLGALGSTGASALAILTAPATMAAATVSLVAIGGAVYVCK